MLERNWDYFEKSVVLENQPLTLEPSFKEVASANSNELVMTIAMILAISLDACDLWFKLWFNVSELKNKKCLADYAHIWVIIQMIKNSNYN